MKNKNWPIIFLKIIFIVISLFLIVPLLEDAEGRTLALGFYTCEITLIIFCYNKKLIRNFILPNKKGVGRRFILFGSIGAFYVELVIWVFEKITGAEGMAASSNLLVNMLVTMPWYVSMISLFWLIYKKFKYKPTTVFLLGGLYEIGGDGIVGHILVGETITPGYLLLLFGVYFWMFTVFYAPMLLLPVWGTELHLAAETKLNLKKVLAVFIPLLPLIPYLFLALIIF